MAYLSFSPPSLVLTHDWRRRFTRLEANGMSAGSLILAATVLSAVYLVLKNWRAEPVLSGEPRLERPPALKGQGGPVRKRLR